MLSSPLRVFFRLLPVWSCKFKPAAYKYYVHHETTEHASYLSWCEMSGSSSFRRAISLCWEREPRQNSNRSLKKGRCAPWTCWTLSISSSHRPTTWLQRVSYNELHLVEGEKTLFLAGFSTALFVIGAINGCNIWGVSIVLAMMSKTRCGSRYL